MNPDSYRTDGPTVIDDGYEEYFFPCPKDEIGNIKIFPDGNIRLLKCPGTGRVDFFDVPTTSHGRRSALIDEWGNYNFNVRDSWDEKSVKLRFDGPEKIWPSGSEIYEFENKLIEINSNGLVMVYLDKKTAQHMHHIKFAFGKEWFWCHNLMSDK